MKKNVKEKFATPGVMTVGCDKCEKTLFLPVTLELWAKIKTFGRKVFKRTCKRCNDEITVTLK